MSMSYTKRLATLLMIVFLVIGQASTVIRVSADDGMSDSELKALNEYPSWVAAICSQDSGDGDSDTTLSGSGNIEKAFSFFVSKGFTPQQSAGIIGNFIQESGVNPKRVEDGWGFPKESSTMPPNKGPQGQPGYGIAQWTSPGRKDGLKNFAKDQGKSVSALSVQVNYVIEEMKKYPGLEGKLKAIKGDDAITKAAFTFHKIYEGSADSISQIQERADSGKQVFKKYGGAATSSEAALPDDTGDSGGGGDCASAMASSDSDGGGSFQNIEYGSKSELINMVLKNNKIVFGNYQSAAVQRDDVKNCLTETTLLGLEAMAEQSGSKILINALASDHGGCNGSSGSLHNSGRAIDIGYYGNGQPNHNAAGDKLYKYLYKNAEALKIDELIWTKPPAGLKCMDSGKPVDCSVYGASTVAQHVHHIHVGFKK